MCEEKSCRTCSQCEDRSIGYGGTEPPETYFRCSQKQIAVITDEYDWSCMANTCESYEYRMPFYMKPIAIDDSEDDLFWVSPKEEPVVTPSWADKEQVA